MIRPLPANLAYASPASWPRLPRNPENREIIRLGSAAGEDQPIGLEAIQVGPQDFGHPLPGVFQNAAGLLARLMLAGRIGISGRVAAGHGLDDLGPGRSCRVVVQINVIHPAIMGRIPAAASRSFLPGRSFTRRRTNQDLSLVFRTLVL